MGDKNFVIKNGCLQEYKGRKATIVIPDNVTIIGERAFEDKKIKEVYIPDSVRKIDTQAFVGCKKLERVRMSENVDVIGTKAFCHCINLESIQLPDKDVFIASGAFEGCVKLKNICITEKTMFSENPFINCKGLADEQGFLIYGGILYGWFGDDDEVVLPQNVRMIGSGAFSSNKCLKKVIIPGETKEIGKEAFCNCRNLTEVQISEGVKHIRAYAFRGCVNLKNLNIPNTIGDIGYNAFADCKGLTDKKGLIIINNTLFGYRGKTQKVAIPNDVKVINDDVFKNCENLKNVQLSEGLKTIGRSSFSGCSNLSSINFPKSLESIGTYAFYGCKSLADTILPNNLDCNYYDVFGRKPDKELADEDGFIIINDELCDYIGKESRIHIPHGVKKIGHRAFENNKELVEVWIPEGVEEIHEFAFRDCIKLESVHMSEERIVIEDKAFWGCKSLSDEQGLIIVGDILHDSISNKTTIIVPEGIKRIAFRAFHGNKNTKKIIIPEGVESIGEGAFSWCENLVEIALPKSLKKIEDEAFQYNKQLSTISIQDSVEIGNRAFRGCKALSDKDGFVIVRSILFDYFGRKRKVVIPPQVKIIDQVYTDNDSVLDIVVPDSVESIRETAFNSRSSLIKVSLPKTLKCNQDDYCNILFVESIIESTGSNTEEEEVFEDNPFASIWRCYDPYIKGKKEVVDRVLTDLNLLSEELKNYQIKEDTVSVGLARITGSTSVSPDCIMDIIKKYPELTVTAMMVGKTDDMSLTVAVVISKRGFPFITDSIIEGNEAADNELVMIDFKDLFKAFSKRKKEIDPHSGLEVEYSVNHRYPFMEEWEFVRD